jgi:hypothetical protein
MLERERDAKSTGLKKILKRERAGKIGEVHSLLLHSSKDVNTQNSISLYSESYGL